MANDLPPFLTVRVDPDDMVQYVHNLMAIPSGAASEASVVLAQRQWGGDTPQARAAHMRWGALNRAFGDVRVGTWTQPRRADQIHVPAALIAAAGVARLTVTENQVVFDIPTLLDTTLQLAQPAGHA
jgi:hypothetical protein